MDRPDDIASADFRFLIERNADGVIVLDSNGTVLFANPAAEEAFGRPVADLVGTPIGVPVVAGETTEIAILRSGGNHIDAEMRVVATTWAGRPALLVSLRDISARKAVEERARQAQKMEAIGRLTAGVAHDFNNLLTVVMGNLATIEREARGGSATPRLRRAAEHAMEGAQRAATLTQRLLAFSRRQPLEPKPVDINELILGISDLLRRTLGETVQIRTELCKGVLQAQVDPGQLEMTLLNLAANARDAMPGGGQLAITTAGCRIDTEDDPTPGDYIEICVRDTGVGMNPETLAQVFEPFFTTKDVGQGTGLGLSQAFGFVKQSGGDIKIRSTPGEGTAVSLYLPSLSVAAQTAEPEEAAPSPTHPREAILVVDDDEAVRAYSVEALRELGHPTIEAGDAAQALEALKAHSDIALLFSDIGLPGGMNGRELADEAQRLRPGLKVLLTTAYAGGMLVSGGRLEPGLQLLSKPFTEGALAAKVRAALEGDVAKPPRILVVEDEVLVRMMIVETLIDVGCRVDEAETASEAIVKFGELSDELDAAMVDIGLPDGRGDGLVSQFRSVRPDLPILLATGYDEVASQEMAADSRLALLGKPFDGRALCAALRRLDLSLAT